MDHDDLLERSFEVRAAAWAQWGAVDDDVLTHLGNPTLVAGGPAWPTTRQAYRVARRPGEVLVASDGLSDPFDPELFELGDVDATALPNGFGHELYAVTDDAAGEIQRSWLMDILLQMSGIAASRQNLVALLDEWALLSTELRGDAVPAPQAERFLTDEQRVGVLLGLTDTVPPREVAGPLSTIRLVNIKVLTRSELAYAVEHGPDGRHELARRFAAQGGVLTSSLDRPGVV